MEKSYLPLFRKYRPQSFSDVVGQKSLVSALSNAIELNRIAQAYLFCGPRGTGKTSCARIFAKSLNCTEGPTLTPCQKCASCVDITKASGLDVIEIDAASNRGIQDAKELIAQAQYAPINGRYKIFIIDEVHMLSTDAFNALLKTFEEPPKNVIFILATTEPHKVLETIVSRCQRYDLRRITTEDIVDRLRKIADLESIKINNDALFTIAKNVSGGLRDSLALLDQVSVLGTKDEIDKSLIEEILGKINFDVLLELLNSINEGNIEKTLKTIDDIYSKGNEPRNLAENFIEFLRNVCLVISSNDCSTITSYTTLIQEDIEKIKEQNFNKEKIIRILDIVIEYYKEIKVSTNPYLWMELAGIAASSADNKKTIQAPIITNNIPKIEPKVEQKAEPRIESKIEPKPEPKTEPIKPENPACDNNKDSSQIWGEIISSIQSLPSRAFFTGVARLVSINDNTITLGFLHENALAQAKQDTKLQALKNAIDSVVKNYNVEFIKIDSSTKVVQTKPKPAPKPQIQPNSAQTIDKPKDIEQTPPQEENPPKPQQKKHYSPKVQEMIEQFSGKIIED